MTRQELENKTVNELCGICKEKGITYYTHNKKLTKAEIIEKILINQDDVNDIGKMINESAEVEESKKNNIFVVNNTKNKLNYIETIQIGVIVAFRELSGKLNTAKVTAKNTKLRRLKLETQYGKKFVIPYESVVWVKTGSRFPRGIYNELKGIKNE